MKLVNTDVYRLKCGNCGSTYVGQTEKALQIGLLEHESNSIRIEKYSIVSKHRFLKINDSYVWLNYNFVFSNIEILQRE